MRAAFDAQKPVIRKSRPPATHSLQLHISALRQAIAILRETSSRVPGLGSLGPCAPLQRPLRVTIAAVARLAQKQPGAGVTEALAQVMAPASLLDASQPGRGRPRYLVLVGTQGFFGRRGRVAQFAPDAGFCFPRDGCFIEAAARPQPWPEEMAEFVVEDATQLSAPRKKRLRQQQVALRDEARCMGRLAGRRLQTERHCNLDARQPGAESCGQRFEPLRQCRPLLY